MTDNSALLGPGTFQAEPRSNRLLIAETSALLCCLLLLSRFVFALMGRIWPLESLTTLLVFGWVGIRLLVREVSNPPITFPSALFPADVVERWSRAARSLLAFFFEAGSFSPFAVLILVCSSLRDYLFRFRPLGQVVEALAYFVFFVSFANQVFVLRYAKINRRS